MIISTGMRTDIPAFYSKWFLNRIKEGFVYVRNPYYPNKVTKYLLNPQVVDCLCFCTKNPIPLIPHLDEINDFKQFWFITITPYGNDMEPNVPDKTKIIKAFKEISKRIGKNGISWRYDPVFYSDEWNLEHHITAFEKIAKALKGYTNSCVISFLDMYEKVKRNAPGIRPPTRQEQMELGEVLSKIAKENGITIRTCCEGTHLARFGIDVNGCQTKEVIERAIGTKLNPPKRKNARAICSCLLGQDIGAYDTCGHLCKYCYANMDKQMVLSNMKKHDPDSPFLIGNLQKGDQINEARQESFVVNQTSLFD